MSAQVESRRQLVRRLREEGVTYWEIGERLGISAQRARQLCMAHTETAGRPEWARELNTRTWMCIKREFQWTSREPGLDTIEGLASFTKAELLNIPNFGRLSLKEVQELLGQHGLRLREP